MKLKQILNKITKPVAKTIGSKIGIDWSVIDIDQFHLGINIEMEHGSQDHETDVIGSDLEAAGKIAWAHLKELSDYYSRLEKMEEEYKDKYGRLSAAKRGYGHGWRKKRKEIVDRDKGKCVKCGEAANEVDHVKSKRKGGKDIGSNLRLLCASCHRKKTKRYDKVEDV